MHRQANSQEELVVSRHTRERLLPLRQISITVRSNVLMAAGLLGLLLCGCGSGKPVFTIASGNWSIPLNSGNPTPTIWVGGQLTQNGDTISGIFHLSGSPCFDPVADQLVVHGNVSTSPGPNGLSLSTAPVRGQVLKLSAGPQASGLPIGPPPPNARVASLLGTWTISGGACAGTGTADAEINDFGSTTWSGGMTGPSWTGNWTAKMSQTGPDAQSFFHVSGTFTVTGSPCFTSGTIASSSVAGEINQITINMDSGQLVGSGFGLRVIPDTEPQWLYFTFTVHGGSCDGQTVTAHF